MFNCLLSQILINMFFCRNAWLVNWLANLSGKSNAFKEMDLLQEHQNFWAKVKSLNIARCKVRLIVLKIIYCAKGSNRSWEWLAMVSVSIFALRDVIRKVQTEYETPLNSISHTSPSTAADVLILRQYLEAQKLQTYCPRREHNEHTTPVRDLMAEGAEYANKPAAFRNFRYTRLSAKHPEGDISVDCPEDLEIDDDSADCDLGHNGQNSLFAEDMEYDGLAFPFTYDEDEYPIGVDIADYVAMTREIVEELTSAEYSEFITTSQANNDLP